MQTAVCLLVDEWRMLPCWRGTLHINNVYRFKYHGDYFLVGRVCGQVSICLSSEYMRDHSSELIAKISRIATIVDQSIFAARCADALLSITSLCRFASSDLHHWFVLG